MTAVGRKAGPIDSEPIGALTRRFPTRCPPGRPPQIGLTLADFRTRSAPRGPLSIADLASCWPTADRSREMAGKRPSASWSASCGSVRSTPAGVQPDRGDAHGREPRHRSDSRRARPPGCSGDGCQGFQDSVVSASLTAKVEGDRM